MSETPAVFNDLDPDWLQADNLEKTWSCQTTGLMLGLAWLAGGALNHPLKPDVSPLG